MMISKNPIYLGMRIFEYFTSIFLSIKFMKLMIGDTRPHISKTVSFGGI